MVFKELIYVVDAGVAIVTFNRPDRLNSFTYSMEIELGQALTAAAADDSVRVIILTGAGRGFCGGREMNLLSNFATQGKIENPPDAPPPVEFSGSARPDFKTRFTYFASLPKPIIAAVNGPCAASGLIYALACDLRFAGSNAFFTTTFSERGLTAESGLAWTLPRLVGHGNAMDMLLSSRRVHADEALRLGLVERVFPQESLMQETLAYAHHLATKISPRSMRIMKRQVWDGLFQTLQESYKEGAAEIVASMDTEDFREGVNSFREKRSPKFTGR